MLKIRDFTVSHPGLFKLKEIDPAATPGIRSKAAAERQLAEDVEELARRQEKLYAQDRKGLLLIFQAMDAAGKDGTIKHVMSGLNPQGCQVYSFKAPSSEELDHDFLWRTNRCLPERGRIGVFNRSYYEEVLVVRVHPEFLAAQKLPPELVTKKIWSERYEDINAMERYLTRNGFVIRKFFLHVSAQEQRRRFLDRLDDPAKNWKFSRADVAERRHWKSYMTAYEEMLRATSTPWAPWYVIPADHKWYCRLAVAWLIGETLREMKLEFPKLSAQARKELAAARRELGEKG